MKMKVMLVLVVTVSFFMGAGFILGENDPKTTIGRFEAAIVKQDIKLLKKQLNDEFLKETFKTDENLRAVLFQYTHFEFIHLTELERTATRAVYRFTLLIEQRQEERELTGVIKLRKGEESGWQINQID